MDDFWVFGYGSLMWRPGFAFKSQSRARLYGYRRTLCIHSYVHRGTKERPGLVLGLDRGGSCCGIGFEVAGADKHKVMQYLRERELATNVYLERICPIQLANGMKVPAYCYVADIGHEQYAGAMHAERAAAIVAGARGQSGENVDYVANCVQKLRAMKLRDPWLETVAEKMVL